MAIGSPKSNTTPVAKQSRTHSHLSQSHDPEKGRQLHATAPIKAGEVLLVDPPYAAIPVVDDPVSSDDVLCSNTDCRRKVPRDSDTRGVKRMACPRRCVDEVVWCNTICRDADAARHQLECAWLKGLARTLREDEGEYYFGVLWLIIRVLAMRHLEQKQQTVISLAEKERFSSGWVAMTELCDNRRLWPREDLREWKWLVRKYICADPSLQDILLPPDDILTLICQQESNSFGLYPRATGIPSSTDRGEQYGAAIFPRSSIANHSCYPNVCFSTVHSFRSRQQ